MAKIFPSKHDLELDAINNLTCNEKGCNKTFKHPSAMRFHLVKVHKIIKNDSDLHLSKKEKMILYDCQYHCPEETCSYNYSDSDSKYFSSMKLLRQHYKQVHCSRKFMCPLCGSKFSRKYDLQRHQTKCNKQFESTDQCILPILGKRRNIDPPLSHTHPDKAKVKEKQQEYILPKPIVVSNVNPLFTNVVWSFNKPVFIDTSKGFDASQIGSSGQERKKSTTTQTNDGLMFRTISIQTVDELFQNKNNKKSQGSQVLLSRNNQLKEHENSHTQTNILTEQASQNYLFRTSINLQEAVAKMNDGQMQSLQNLCGIQPTSSYLFGYGDDCTLNRFLPTCMHDEQVHPHCMYLNNTSQTDFIQTSEYFKTLSSISQQTSCNELSMDINCSAATQTCNLLHHGESAQDLTLSNIETQTNDLFDLDNLEYIDALVEYATNETQTILPWDNFLDQREHLNRLNGLLYDTETQTHN